jgi:hypothetical protein
MYHAVGMRELHDQELALFARRAHRRFGRGFVLSDTEEARPVYVTWIIGAPPPLVDAVFDYDPEHEAVVVSEDDNDEGSLIINYIRIESRH